MSGVERLVRRERAVVAAGLTAVVLLAWMYLVTGAGAGMPVMDHGDQLAAPAGGQFLVTFAMWGAMMPAMMLPSAAPMILLYGAVSRRTTSGPTVAASGVFASGYVAAWSVFALGVAGLQVVLHRAALLSPSMQTTSTVLGGGILVAAGVYQLTRLKHACLRHCRSPVQFLTRHWRPGSYGAFRMGLVHGVYCLGCCWMLMALLFVVGVMSLLWVAGIALAVMAEKLAPAGGWLARATGVGLIGWGAVTVGIAFA